MATIKTRKEAGGYQWTHEVVFDFSTLSEEQQQELMTASAIIRWQARARKLSEKELTEMAKAEVKVDASTLFERAAPVTDPTKVVDRLTEEQAKVLMAELAKKFGIK